MALGTAGLRDDPLPQGDSGFLEAPSFARRLAAGSFVFSSPGEAPAKPGMREGGKAPSWWQLGGKVPAFPAVPPCSGSPLCCLLSCSVVHFSHARAEKGLLDVLWAVAGLC